MHNAYCHTKNTSQSAALCGALVSSLLFAGYAQASDCSGGFIEMNGVRRCLRQTTVAEREAHRQYVIDKVRRRDQAILEARERQRAQDEAYSNAVREYQRGRKVEVLEQRYNAQDEYVDQGIDDPTVDTQEFRQRLNVLSDINDQILDAKYDD